MRPSNDNDSRDLAGAIGGYALLIIIFLAAWIGSPQ